MRAERGHGLPRFARVTSPVTRAGHKTGAGGELARTCDQPGVSNDGAVIGADCTDNRTAAFASKIIEHANEVGRRLGMGKPLA